MSMQSDFDVLSGLLSSFAGHPIVARPRPGLLPFQQFLAEALGDSWTRLQQDLLARVGDGATGDRTPLLADGTVAKGHDSAVRGLGTASPSADGLVGGQVLQPADGGLRIFSEGTQIGVDRSAVAGNGPNVLSGRVQMAAERAVSAGSDVVALMGQSEAGVSKAALARATETRESDAHAKARDRKTGGVGTGGLATRLLAGSGLAQAVGMPLAAGQVAETRETAGTGVRESAGEEAASGSLQTGQSGAGRGESAGAATPGLVGSGAPAVRSDGLSAEEAVGLSSSGRGEWSSGVAGQEVPSPNEAPARTPPEGSNTGFPLRAGGHSSRTAVAGESNVQTTEGSTRVAFEPAEASVRQGGAERQVPVDRGTRGAVRLEPANSVEPGRAARGAVDVAGLEGLTLEADSSTGQTTAVSQRVRAVSSEALDASRVAGSKVGPARASDFSLEGTVGLSSSGRAEGSSGVAGQEVASPNEAPARTPAEGSNTGFPLRAGGHSSRTAVAGESNVQTTQGSTQVAFEPADASVRQGGAEGQVPADRGTRGAVRLEPASSVEPERADGSGWEGLELKAGSSAGATQLRTRTPGQERLQGAATGPASASSPGASPAGSPFPGVTSGAPLDMPVAPEAGTSGDEDGTAAGRSLGEVRNPGVFRSAGAADVADRISVAESQKLASGTGGAAPERGTDSWIQTPLAAKLSQLLEETGAEVVSARMGFSDNGASLRGRLESASPDGSGFGTKIGDQTQDAAPPIPPQDGSGLPGKRADVRGGNIGVSTDLLTQRHPTGRGAETRAAETGSRHATVAPGKPSNSTRVVSAESRVYAGAREDSASVSSRISPADKGVYQAEGARAAMAGAQVATGAPGGSESRAWFDVQPGRASAPASAQAASVRFSGGRKIGVNAEGAARAYTAVAQSPDGDEQASRPASGETKIRTTERPGPGEAAAGPGAKHSGTSPDRSPGGARPAADTPTGPATAGSGTASSDVRRGGAPHSHVPSDGTSKQTPEPPHTSVSQPKSPMDPVESPRGSETGKTAADRPARATGAVETPPSGESPASGQPPVARQKTSVAKPNTGGAEGSRRPADAAQAEAARRGDSKSRATGRPTTEVGDAGVPRTQSAQPVVGKELHRPAGVSRRAPAGPTTGSAARTEHVLKQLHTQLVRHRLSPDRGSLVVQLRPPELGRIRIHVETHGNVLRAVVEADSAATRELLHNGTQQLVQTLDQQGLKVHQIQVVPFQTGQSGVDQDRGFAERQAAPEWSERDTNGQGRREPQQEDQQSHLGHGWLA